MAYPYISRNKDAMAMLSSHAEHIDLFLDSGAFTAWKSGVSISLDDYCRFLEGCPVKPWRYFMLDVVGNPEATMRNFREMVRRGFRPVPVFTAGSPAEYLEEYFAHSDLVGFGGIATKGSNATRNYITFMMQRSRGRNVHLLGYTSLKYLKIFRPYSCDSNSWECGARYGSFCLYMGNGASKTISRDDVRKGLDRRVITRVYELGCNPKDLFKNENWSGGLSIQRTLGGASAVALSLDIQKHIGTRMFMAATTGYAIRILIQNYLWQVYGVRERLAT